MEDNLNGNEYLLSIIKRGYGLITCGNHKGIMVSPEINHKKCPIRWAFFPTEKIKDLTEQQALVKLQEAINFVQNEIE